MPSTILDRTGVAASVLCAVHCAIAPVLLLAAPTLGGIWAHPASHIAIAAVVLPVAALALRHGFRSHGRRWVMALGAIGIGLVVTGTALPYIFESSVLEPAAGGAAAPAAGGTECTSCDGCCPSIIVDEETGEQTLHVPTASVVNLFGGVSLIVAHLANLRCCRLCG